MKIPDKIKVGGMTYKVIKNYKFTETVGICAQIDNSKNVIRIANENSGMEGQSSIDKIHQSFFHELMHAIDYVYNSDKISREDDDIIERLSQGLYQVFKDNKL